MPPCTPVSVEPACCDQYLRRQVEQVLIQREMMSLKELARLVKTPVGDLTRLLPDWLEDSAAFECLLPLFASSGNPELVFFRRRSHSDTAYLWEKDVCESNGARRHAVSEYGV